MPSIPLLVCDDSSMVRKQLLRALPPEWAVSVTEVDNGKAGLEAIRQGLGRVVLLDLTMPVMDGYQVLSAVREEGLQAHVIVISADVQEEARRRVLDMGALAFLRKPFDPDEFRATLHQHGLLAVPQQDIAANSPTIDGPSTFRDVLQETVNVAIGRAGALLARVLDVFVQLPVPNVNLLEVGELHMALADVQRGDERLTAICQGYIGSGIAGEALLIFHDSEIADMATLLHRDGNDGGDLEMLLDLSTLLIGACLSGIAEQIDVVFSQSHPQILGEHLAIDELIQVNSQRNKKTLAVEISYSLEGHDIHFDLLMLFSEDSVQLLNRKLAYLMN